VIRLAALLATNGASQYPRTGDAPISVQGQIGGAGGRRYYQIWYRNADPTFCTASTFNLTKRVVRALGAVTPRVIESMVKRRSSAHARGRE